MDGSQAERTLKDGDALYGAGLIAADAVAPADLVGARYAIAVTPHLTELIHRGGADNPIARQYLPDPRELVRGDEERDDPIGDGTHMAVEGLVHRYPDRVLLMPTTVCPVYCRFCFRREKVGHSGGMLSEDATEAALSYIAARPTIREVILTGGDPLILSPRRLGALLERLAGIENLDWLRIHTRVPVADPRRIDTDLLRALDVKKSVYVSVHCNHSAEIDASASKALGALADAGIPLLAQTVLLRGVNDDPDTLADLFRTLLRHRVKPYYLHHPDLAPGTGHFRLTVEEGQAIMAALRGRISGLALPTYVIDIPGGHGKVPIGPDFRDADDGALTDWRGAKHNYPPA